MRLSRSQLLPGSGEANAAVFSPNGHSLATVGQDGNVRLWDTTRGHQTARPAGHPDRWTRWPSAPTAPRWSAPATTAPSGCGAREHTGSLPDRPRRPSHLRGLQPGRHARLASASFDGTVRLWDTNSYQQLGQPLTGHSGAVNAVAFSPDGKTLATAGADHTVRLWDPSAHQQSGEPFAGRRVVPFNSAFSPDGKTVATADGAGTARLSPHIVRSAPPSRTTSAWSSRRPSAQTAKCLPPGLLRGKPRATEAEAPVARRCPAGRPITA